METYRKDRKEIEYDPRLDIRSPTFQPHLYAMAKMSGYSEEFINKTMDRLRPTYPEKPSYPGFFAPGGEATIEWGGRAQHPVTIEWDGREQELTPSEKLPKKEQEKAIFKFKTLSEAILFAEANADRIGGHSIKMEADEWQDNYGFYEFINHYKNFHNKNKKSADKDIKKITEYLKSCIEANKKHFIPQNVFEEYNDVTGGIVDVGAFLSGQNECMINFGEPKKKKAVSICFNLGNGHAFSDQISTMGKIIYCLTSLLKERALTIYGYANSSDIISCCIPIVSSSANISMSQIELVLLNLKAFYRRICFALFEAAPKKIKDKAGVCINGDYGYPGDINRKMLNADFGINPDIIITRSMMSYGLEACCDNVIKEIIESQSN